MSFSKVICVVDDDVDVQDVALVAWRVLANLDPKRDLSFVDGPIDQLDHGANQSLWGSKTCIDGTRKWREEGYAREWPEPCRTSRDVEARVNSLWSELGLAASGTNAQAGRRRDAEPPTSANGHPGPSAIARAFGMAREILDRVRP
jgi:4-hydroxy-3-polyprenylbenzoate decarboxylase